MPLSEIAPSGQLAKWIAFVMGSTIDSVVYGKDSTEGGLSPCTLQVSILFNCASNLTISNIGPPWRPKVKAPILV